MIIKQRVAKPNFPQRFSPPCSPLQWLVSLGLVSLGLVSLGLVSLGLVSLGLVSLGLVSLGLVSLGLVSLAVRNPFFARWKGFRGRLFVGQSIRIQ